MMPNYMPLESSILLLQNDAPTQSSNGRVALVSQKYEACAFSHQSQNLKCSPLASSFLLCNGVYFLLSSPNSEKHKCIVTDLTSMDLLRSVLLL